MVKKINEAAFNEVLEQEYAIVDFSATWCGPCKMLAPVLEEISEEMAGKVAFYNVDCDESASLAQQYKIVSIPALVAIKNGEMVDTMVGFQPKAGVESFINSHM